MSTTCRVCMHHCRLEEGKTGRCRARKNVEGKIESVNYGMCTALALDSVEKKPLQRFCPGKMVLSVGSFGCNLSCPFCQNHEISMCGEKALRCEYFSPKELAQQAEKLKARGNLGVAFTYNEPLVGYEYVRDTAREVRRRGMKTILVTNGAFTEETEEAVLPYIDAMNIDLKGFTEAYYKKLGGDLETVKAFIAKAAGVCHVELTTLVVPGENDSAGEIQELAEWVASVDYEIPLHVTRFFPRWRMTDQKATEVEAVYRLAGEAGKYLKYVYTGNC